jgi:hypothetical protein
MEFRMILRSYQTGLCSIGWMRLLRWNSVEPKCRSSDRRLSLCIYANQRFPYLQFVANTSVKSSKARRLAHSIGYFNGKCCLVLAFIDAGTQIYPTRWRPYHGQRLYSSRWRSAIVEDPWHTMVSRGKFLLPKIKLSSIQLNIAILATNSDRTGAGTIKFVQTSCPWPSLSALDDMSPDL